MEEKLLKRQDQALSFGFAVLMRFSWILAMTIMVASMGFLGLLLGAAIGLFLALVKQR